MKLTFQTYINKTKTYILIYGKLQERKTLQIRLWSLAVPGRLHAFDVLVPLGIFVWSECQAVQAFYRAQLLHLNYT